MANLAAMFKSDTKVTWCPGCGDYGVLNAIQSAMSSLDLDPDSTFVVSGIGCSSNLPHFLKTYGFHSIHGRALPVASGAKLANDELTVIVTGGDGDGWGIGMGHFMHGMRRNWNLTYIVMDNQIYGLTTGQCSPTSEKGHKTKSTPEGNLENPVNPIANGIAAGATYVARAFSGDPAHMTELIKNGIAHKGFSLIDVFSPCVTYNKANTYQWFRERVYKLDGTHDITNKAKAFERALEWGNKIPIGLFYKENKPTYDSEEPVLKKGPLVKQPIGLNQEKFGALMHEFY